MEPHATIAAWEGDQLHLWTSNQMIAWTVKDMAETFGMPAEKIHVSSPFIGGGFGGKLFLRSDILMAALAARAARCPVKVTLQRALIPNNTTHRAATIQRIRLGAGKDGRITAIAHESWSGNVEGGRPETAVLQTRALYSGAHRMTALRLARHDLPEANAMRAPGEAPGLAALEIAMDEMAEKLSIDPVEFRILNDTQTVPDSPPPPEPKKTASKAEKEKGEKKGKDSESTPPPPANPPFSKRQLVECLREGAKRFGWEKRQPRPGQMREGRWLIGLGMAVAFRDNMLMKSAARVRLEPGGQITVETDMTDIGTGSYTILAQTAAEMLGVPLEQVTVRLGDSKFPVSCGSGGQFGGNNSCAGVYAACVKLREAIAKKAGIAAADTALFAEGKVTDPATGNSLALTDAAGKAGLVGEDGIEYSPDLDKQHRQSTFGGHFVEVAVDSFTGEVRVRRMLAVCAAGRILNPKTARSQVIGAMTMGVGVALMEALHVDKKRGYFVNHDLAGYEVPVHADIPHQEVVFLEETDPLSSPMKAKGIAELGICGVAAAVSNAIYNATGIRVREYPLTLDKLLKELPSVA